MKTSKKKKIKKTTQTQWFHFLDRDDESWNFFFSDSFTLKKIRAQTIEIRHRTPCRLIHNKIHIRTEANRITQFVVASLLKMS